MRDSFSKVPRFPETSAAHRAVRANRYNTDTPYRVLLRERDASLLARKAIRKLGTVARHAIAAGRKAIARAYYSLPGMSKRDPRRTVVRFRDHCVRVDEVPTGAGVSIDWYLTIRPSEIVRRKPSIVLDDEQAELFRRGSAPYQYGETSAVPEVFLAGLCNATIHGANFIVLSEDNHIMLESALSRQDVLEASGLYYEIVPAKRQHFAGNYCLLASPWSSFAYYHWVMDALPRLSLIEQAGEIRTWPLIVPGKLAQYHTETLRMAGVAPERIVPFHGGRALVDRLVFPETLSTTGNPSRQTVAWLRERFLPKSSERTGTRRLYVTRRDKGKRIALNESEIIDYLTQEGFEVVCPGDLPFGEQVALFSDASIVVGPHGAGMTNMAFAPTGATIVEFFGDNYINGCFWALANIRGQRHASIISPALGVGAGHIAEGGPLDYAVPLPRIEALLAKLDVV
jgi:hypothetical protein